MLNLTSSCNKNKNENERCDYYDEAFVVSVNGPETSTINEEKSFNVEFAVLNGCGQFARFEEKREQNNIFIDVIARYNRCIFCTQDIPHRQAIYKFKSTTPGTYYFEYKVPGYSSVRDTLVVH